MIAVRPVKPGDYPALLAIYNHVVAHTTAIYCDDPADLAYIQDYAEKRVQAGFPFLVAETEAGNIVGYGTFGPFRARPGYRYTVEHSVHIHHEMRGKGIGSKLLKDLIKLGKEGGYHLMIGAVDGENQGSVAFHAKHGFAAAGRIDEVAFKFDRWLDVVFVAKKL